MNMSCLERIVKNSRIFRLYVTMGVAHTQAIELTFPFEPGSLYLHIK